VKFEKWFTNGDGEFSREIRPRHGNEAGENKFVDVVWVLWGSETLKELELEAGCTVKRINILSQSHHEP
jgi:hypothetical protein